MSVVVISQPMYFPWLGLFEQVALADVFVHYDNVQLPQGRSFITRVQIKTPQGTQWLTVPVKRSAGQLIADVRIDHSSDWRRKHLMSLKQAYAGCPYVEDMLGLVESVFAKSSDSLSEMNIHLIEKIADYLGIEARFERSSAYPSNASGTQKLLELCQRFDAKTYVTGHGALNYLDHGAFASAGIAVLVMDYRCVEYDQSHGTFTPYVSVLDAIASCGPSARSLLQPQTRDWRDMVDDRA